MRYHLYNYEQTKYPKIYTNTYWGNFKELVNKEIIDNRNDFVTKYNIKGWKNKSVGKILHEYGYIFKSRERPFLSADKRGFFTDHLELYSTYKKNETIGIASYNYTLCEEKQQILLNDGWSEIYPLYGIGDKTYIKRI